MDADGGGGNGELGVESGQRRVESGEWRVGGGRLFSACGAAGEGYDLRRHQKTNEGMNMGGRRGIWQKEQTRQDLGPAGLVQETLLNRCIRMADREPVCVI
jgi:hypothetical protein